MEGINKPKKQSKFKNLLFENRFVLAAFGAAVLIMLVVFICLSVIPFGNRTVLRMDLYHQYGPMFAELYERITNGDSLLYTWTMGLGVNFLGNLFNYLASPFTLLILLFGHKNIPVAIGLLMLLKAAFSASTFAYYIKHSFHKNDCSLPAFGLMYAFCAFFVAYSWNIMWLDAMIYFPLVILGIEKIINRQQWGLYTGALALTMFSNFYMAFMTCLFSIFYFVVYYASHYSFVSRVSTGLKESRISAILSNRFINAGLRFALCSVLAAGIMGVVLLPTYFSLTTSSATSGTFPEKMSSYFNIFDFLTNHLAYMEPTIRSSGSDVLPNVYCGMMTVLCLPLYLFCKKINVREKCLYLAFAAFLFLSFDNNFLNFIWHGFHFPNDLPYRFSFMYSFLLLIMAYKVLCNIRSFSRTQIVSSAIAIIAFIIVAQKVESKNLTDTAVLISIVFVLVYTGILLAMNDRRYLPGVMSAVMLCCVFSEIAVANTDHYTMNQSLDSYASDLATFEELKEELDTAEDGGFYRMELSKLRTRNDPAWYYYNGISTFSSMAYESVAKSQKNLGISSNNINSYTYNPQTPLYNSIFSLSYIVENEGGRSMSPLYYEKANVNGKFTAYRNKYCLPIAFAVNRDILQYSSTYANPFDAQETMYQTMADNYTNIFLPVEVEHVSSLNVSGVPIDFESGAINFTRTGDSDASITVTLKAPENGAPVYLYVQSSDTDSMTVSCDEDEWTADTSRPFILDTASHPAGESIEVTIPIKENEQSGTVNFYACTIDDQAFQDCYNELAAGGMEIDAFTDTHISGTFTTQADQILFTSIPYDSGWTVKVDGEKVEPSLVDEAYMAIDVSAGTHTIEFSYMPSGLIAGVVLSVVSVLVLIAAVLWRKKHPPVQNEEELPAEFDPEILSIDQIKVEKANLPPVEPSGSDPLPPPGKDEEPTQEK